MLHNSGPYGPNDVPITMGVPVNMTQMTNPINLGNNLGNLAKIPQQTPQASAPHYNMPDYTSFGHPPLAMGHSMDPFANYQHLNIQSNYTHTHPNLSHEATPNNIQNGILPMNLNTQSDHGHSLTNYHSFDAKRFDVNNTNYTDTLSRKMPINIPQVHTKAFHKQLGMDTNYAQYNSAQENPFYNQDLLKTPERPLLDSNRRKSLENTVKLIENILINNTPKDKLKNINSTDSISNNTQMSNTLDTSSKLPNTMMDCGKKVDNQNLDLTHKMIDIHNPGYISHNMDIESSNNEIKHTKTDTQDFNINLTDNMDISNCKIDLKTTKLKDTNVNIDHTKHSNETINISTCINTATANYKAVKNETVSEAENTNIQSKIHCEPLRRSLMNNNRTVTDKIAKDISKIHNPGDEKKDLHVEMDSEKDEPTLQVKIKEEVTDDTIKVKVEPLDRAETDNLPFLKDTNAISKDVIEDDATIIEENNIAEAQEAMKNGPNPKTYYECSHCNLLFKHPKRFLIHSKWHSFGLTNDKRQELAREKEMKKSMKREAKIIERLNSKEVKEGAEGDAHPCKDCDKVFAGKSSLKNHRQRYHPTRVRECKICNLSVVGWMALRAHMASHAAGSGYQCPECPKRFKYAHSLAKHKDTHLEKTHGCEQCEKKFGSQALLKMHMKCHERTARGATFRCTYCGKGFFESYNLQVHERTHRNERPFLCEICKTSFGTNSSLKRHLKVSHSTAKPFPCPLCQRHFASATTRARHAARHHADPDTLTHKCTLCPRRYRALKELHRHVSKAHPDRRE